MDTQDSQIVTRNAHVDSTWPNMKWEVNIVLLLTDVQNEIIASYINEWLGYLCLVSLIWFYLSL